jgi:hypothetical protein
MENSWKSQGNKQKKQYFNDFLENYKFQYYTQKKNEHISKRKILTSKFLTNKKKKIQKGAQKNYKISVFNSKIV